MSAQRPTFARPNFTLKLTAGRLPRPGLKPLVSSDTHGVTPLADALMENAASGVPLCPPARGASLQLSVRSVRPMNHRRREGTLSMRLRVPARMGRKMEHVTPMQGSIPGLQ